LRDSLDTPCQVVSLSGPSKSGKTVLVEKVVGRDLLISLSGASIRHPDEVWQKVLDWMDVPNSTSTGRFIGGTVGAEVTAKGAPSAGYLFAKKDKERPFSSTRMVPSGFCGIYAMRQCGTAGRA
jgi:hypothetical protein